MVDCIVHKLHMVKLLAHTKMEKKKRKAWLCCQTSVLFILLKIKAFWHT